MLLKYKTDILFFQPKISVSSSLRGLSSGPRGSIYICIQRANTALHTVHIGLLPLA